MACPATFPAGSLTADGEAAPWIGASVCLDEVTGQPACFPNQTALGAETPEWFLERVKRNPWINASTPCPLDDGDCYQKFYNCKSMYEHTFKSGYDAWELIMFLLFVGATSYCGQQLYNVVHYATEKQKQAGFLGNIKFQILCLNLAVVVMRTLFYLNAHSDYGWTGLVWPNWFRAILMKMPQMLLCWSVLVQCIFWRDTVQKAKELRKVLKQTKLRKFIKFSAVLLFGVCVPAEVVARSVPGAPVYLDFIVSGFQGIYGLVLTNAGVVASTRLAAMLHEFQLQRSAQGMGREVGMHMRKTIKKIYNTVLWFTLSGYLMIARQNERATESCSFFLLLCDRKVSLLLLLFLPPSLPDRHRVQRDAEQPPVEAAYVLDHGERRRVDHVDRDDRGHAQGAVRDRRGEDDAPQRQAHARHGRVHGREQLHVQVRGLGRAPGERQGEPGAADGPGGPVVRGRLGVQRVDGHEHRRRHLGRGRHERPQHGHHVVPRRVVDGVVGRRLVFWRHPGSGEDQPGRSCVKLPPPKFWAKAVDFLTRTPLLSSSVSFFYLA